MPVRPDEEGHLRGASRRRVPARAQPSSRMRSRRTHRAPPAGWKGSSWFMSRLQIVAPQAQAPGGNETAGRRWRFAGASLAVAGLLRGGPGARAAIPRRPAGFGSSGAVGARSVSTLRGMAVTAPVSTVDPPDLSFGPTARICTREWWVERRLVGIGLLCALATTALGIAIPVAGAARDRQLDRRQGPLQLALYLGLIARLRVPALRDQLDAAGDHLAHRHRHREPPAGDALRRLSDLSARVLRRHATGQVLSRATNDLYPIRYFIGWGVVQVCSSVMMIIGVAIVLLSVNARLGAVSPASRCR